MGFDVIGSAVIGGKAWTQLGEVPDFGVQGKAINPERFSYREKGDGFC